MLGGRGPGDQLAGLRVDVQPCGGRYQLQVGQQLRLVGPIDRIDLQARLLLRRVVGLHLLQHGLGHGVLRGRGIGADLVGLRVQDENGPGEQLGQDVHRHGGVGGLDGVNDQLQLLGRGRRLHLRRHGWFGNRLDHGADRPHDPGRVRDQDLLGGRQRHDFAVWPEQGSDLARDGLRVPSTQGEQHTHPFKTSSFI